MKSWIATKSTRKTNVAHLRAFSHLGAQNRDLKEIPENVKNDLAIHCVKWIDEVFELALEHSVEKWKIDG